MGGEPGKIVKNTIFVPISDLWIVSFLFQHNEELGNQEWHIETQCSYISQNPDFNHTPIHLQHHSTQPRISIFFPSCQRDEVEDWDIAQEKVDDGKVCAQGIDGRRLKSGTPFRKSIDGGFHKRKMMGMGWKKRHFPLANTMRRMCGVREKRKEATCFNLQ